MSYKLKKERGFRVLCGRMTGMFVNIFQILKRHRKPVLLMVNSLLDIDLICSVTVGYAWIGIMSETG